MTTTYKQAAEELRGNDKQWLAYESEGNCVVLAGPGAGKTKTITIKIARLLNEEIKRPRRLACITYSNACVGELLSRLRRLGAGDDPRLRVATVHSFCLTELVLPYARLAGITIPDPLTVASPSQCRKLMEKAYAQTLKGAMPKWYPLECDRLRRTVLDRDSAEWKTWPTQEPLVVEAYEKLLLANGLIDFDGIVLTGLRLVENHKWVRDCLRAKYPIIVIDEYQDLGLPLHRMVLALMTKAGVRIIAVGDSDQSIYGFTGAKPALLKSLQAVTGIESIALNLNYRCANKIIAASQSLLPVPGEFKSHDGRQGEIFIYKLKCDVRKQADYALGKLVPAMLKENPGWQPGDIAMLYRSLNGGQLIADAADALDMPYFRLDNGSPIKKSRFTEWLTDVAKWCSEGWQSGSVSLADLMKNWRAMRRSLTREADVLKARSELISFLFSNRDGSIMLHKWLNAFGEQVLNQMFAEEKALGDEREIFESLQEKSEKGGALEKYTVQIFASHGKSPDQVNLMTLHSSKGLEFQAVIMIGLEEGSLPSTYDKTADQIAEAGRLFYVGVTRAKSLVHLIYGFNESPLVTKIRQAT
jgi:ATP-dependent DNA helicase Rep